MAGRRGPGEGGLHWDDRRQRWIATADLGFTPAGKRIRKSGSGRTKTEARQKLKDVLRDRVDGLAIAPAGYTVADAVRDWLAYGLADRDEATVKKAESLCRNHVLPALAARRLRELSADDVDRWLANKATTLSTSTLQNIRGCLNRAVNRAMARDKVKRNVVALCTVPKGRPGRRSKALTMAQAEAVLAAVKGSRMEAYVVVSLLTGARTEELRALTWDHVDLEGKSDAARPIPPSIKVWCSVRDGGDTKTRSHGAP